MFKKRSSKKESRKLNEDTSWIVEGIVEFLTSPTWKAPVLNFVDSQCGSFTHSEECSFEHTEIHKKYKDMVEQLLGTYMKELGISEKQFSSACSPSNSDIAQLHRNFEYIWAADDFLIFKRLMASHNVRLEREALEMLGSTSDTSKKLTSEDADTLTKMLKSSKLSLSERKARQNQEDEDLRVAIEFSKMEMERLNAISNEEKRLLEQAIRMSLETSQSEKKPIMQKKDFQSYHPTGATAELTKPIAVIGTLPENFSAESLDVPASYRSPQKEKDDRPGATKPDQNIVDTKSKQNIELLPQAEKPHPPSKTSSLPPLKSKKDVTSAEAANAWLDQAMKGIVDSPKHSSLLQSNNGVKSGSIDPAELAKRKAYLQGQRDKLLAQRTNERNQELVKFMENKKEEKMPQSDPVEDKRLASRRAVAERLKREVINKD